MRITKHEHACLILELAGKRLVIDPGSYTTALLAVDDVVGIVITHEHPDHWTPEQLQRLLDRNPDAVIFGPAGVVAAAEGFDVTESSDGMSAEAGPFELKFFGSEHAVIHSSIPVIDNVGVMVNDELFYPGDAFTVPPVPVKTLAAPCAAPWLKISEAMDYVTAVAPKRCFPVHEMVLSVIGKGMANDRLRTMTERAGGEFHALEPMESLDV